MLISSLILENQAEYLRKKYGDAVSMDDINLAIATDNSLAEKLIFGLCTGVIDNIGPESLDLVRDLDPFRRETQKSEANIKYEETQNKAQQINRQYYQWIIKVWKANGEDFPIDIQIFDYLAANDIAPGDIKDLSYELILRRSVQWHEEVQKVQRNYGVLQYNKDNTPGELPEGQNYEEYGGFYFLKLQRVDAEVEGKMMQNCIGGHMISSTGDRYIISMRNKKNYPVADIRVQNNVITEIKGRQNQPPVPKYQLPIIEWLKGTDLTIQLNYDVVRIIEEAAPKIINKLASRIKWTTAHQAKWASFFSTSTADYVVTKLLTENPSCINDISLTNTSEHLMTDILDRMKNDKIVLYSKILMMYSKNEDKNGQYQQRLLRAAGDDLACISVYNSVFNPQAAVDSILPIPPSEFPFLFDRFRSVFDNLDIKDVRLTPYAERMLIANDEALLKASISRYDSVSEWHRSTRDLEVRRGLLSLLLCIPVEDTIRLISERANYSWVLFQNIKEVCTKNPGILDKIIALGISNLFDLFMENRTETPQINDQFEKLMIYLVKLMSHEQISKSYRKYRSKINKIHLDTLKSIILVLDIDDLNIDAFDAQGDDDELDLVDAARLTSNVKYLRQIAASSNQDAASIAKSKLDLMVKCGKITL